MLHMIYEIAYDLSMQMTCYVVYIGRVPGVYDHWEDCLKQVNKFKGNSYKGYNTRAEAESRWANHLGAETRANRMKTIYIATALLLVAFLLYVLVVV